MNFTGDCGSVYLELRKKTFTGIYRFDILCWLRQPPITTTDHVHEQVRPGGNFSWTLNSFIHEIILYVNFFFFLKGASLVSLVMVKNLPAMQETQVRSLGQEDPPGRGNGNPLQYSCLEDSMDRGIWWAALHGVAQSRTQLKRLSLHACTGEGNGNPLL